MLIAAGAAVDLSTLGDDLLELFHKTLGYRDATVKSQSGEKDIRRVTLKFPILSALGLSTHPDEALHLKVEISHHPQVAVIKQTPLLFHGRSFVPAHFSLETMMAGKMIACLERSFQRGKEGAFIKGRDYYDLLWFMQKQILPLEEKLAQDGKQPYDVRSAMLALKEKVADVRSEDLAVDLLPMFESRVFIEAWIEAFHENFKEFLRPYV
ncbi:MAG: hypothetical protein C0393_01005 [Anaerolinea sp.]|nr:hypothetical protein [Anaerolinea sp.]